jgi:hypothetical protein
MMWALPRALRQQEKEAGNQFVRNVIGAEAG